MKGAEEEARKPQKADRNSDYLTAAQLNRCIEKLKTGSKVEIVSKMADSLRVSISRKKSKEKHEAAKQAN